MIRLVPLVVALLVAGCAADPVPPPPPPLEGIEWRAVRVAGLVPTRGSEPTLRLGAGQIGGSGGCNTFGGGARLDGDRLVVDEVVMTMILCDGLVGRVEAAYFRVLRERPAVGAVDGQLVLRSPSGDVVFAAVP